MNQTEEKKKFAEWGILELMGHRRLGGYLTEQEIAGAAFIRIDIPGDEKINLTSQFYSPQAVYCFTPTTEQTARAVAIMSRPEPVHRWEFPRLSDHIDVEPEDEIPFEDAV